jgi:cyanophycinase
MLTRLLLLLPLLLPALLLTACSTTTRAPSGSSGTLILIGGGLERDNEPVYRRMLELAKHPATGTPRILIATAASLEEKAAAESATAAFHRYDPAATISAISRDTPTAEAVAAINAAHLVFFTGGDQKRIIDLYRPAGIDKPEATALRSLLARTGTIAGTSAGLAMMSDPMFLTGSSDDALENGPKIGPGMGFIPHVITDSHFVERARLGRLYTALVASNRLVGVGVAENAASEFDIGSGLLTALTKAPTVIVDAAGAKREGGTITNLLAKPLTAGESIRLHDLTSKAARMVYDWVRINGLAPMQSIAAVGPNKRHTFSGVPVADGWTQIEIRINDAPKAPTLPPLNDEKPAPAR